MFRSKVEWVEKGEKPTKYFFNLERKNYEKKTILQLKIGDNEVASDLQRINQEIESFYKDLLKTRLTESQERNSKTNFEDFIDELTDLPKLSYD